MILSHEELLASAGPAAHLVQLYESDDAVLARNVGRFFFEGLRAGDSAVMITSPKNVAAFQRELASHGVDVAAALHDGRLTVLEAEETLSRFMLGGYPDAARFDSVIGTLVRHLVETNPRGGLRAYGDMVGVLWKRRHFPAAIRLEQLWGKLLESVPFSLFCGYEIDIFGGDFESGVVDAMLCAHTHFMPAGSNDGLRSSVERAIGDVLGTNVTTLASIKREHRSAWPAMPEGEAMILWVRQNLREHANDIFLRAREYYQAGA